MSDKKKVTVEILIKMEKALRLKALTGFEEDIVRDRRMALRRYNMKTVFSEKQMEILDELAERYDQIKR
jgi:hypothetical protein